MNVAELKEMWREENWERKVNGIPRIKWADFKNRTWIVECPSESDNGRREQCISTTSK